MVKQGTVVGLNNDDEQKGEEKESPTKIAEVLTDTVPENGQKNEGVMNGSDLKRGASQEGNTRSRNFNGKGNKAEDEADGGKSDGVKLRGVRILEPES